MKHVTQQRDKGRDKKNKENEQQRNFFLGKYKQKVNVTKFSIISL